VGCGRTHGLKEGYEPNTKSLEGDQEQAVMRRERGRHTLMVCGVD